MQLTAKERRILRDVVGKLNGSSQKVRRAQMLLAQKLGTGADLYNRVRVTNRHARILSMAEEEKCFRYRILTKPPATAEDLSLPEQVRTEVSTAVRAVACQQHFLRPGTMSGGSIGAAVRQTVGAAFNLDLEAMPKPVVTKLQTSLHNILAEPNKSSFTIPVSDALNYMGVTKLSDDLWLEVIFMPTGQKAVSAGWKKTL